MILVVCAVSDELGGFARGGVDVVTVGVGPVEAAIGALRALAARPYSLAINAGIGGGFAGRAAVGDAVAVSAERYVELGREDRGELALPEGVHLETICAADARMLERYRESDPAVAFGLGITSATVTTTAERAAALDALYSPATESMEGFAVLRAAAALGIPAIELRGIANVVGERSTNGWDFRAGSAAAVRALNDFLDIVQPTV